MLPNEGAVLVPALNTTVWEQGLGCRVALFRDWGWPDDERGEADSIVEVRFAEVLKSEGLAAPRGRSRLVGFRIGEVRQLVAPVSLLVDMLPVPQRRFTFCILKNIYPLAKRDAFVDWPSPHKSSITPIFQSANSSSR